MTICSVPLFLWLTFSKLPPIDQRLLDMLTETPFSTFFLGCFIIETKNATDLGTLVRNMPTPLTKKKKHSAPLASAASAGDIQHAQWFGLVVWTWFGYVSTTNPHHQLVKAYLIVWVARVEDSKTAGKKNTRKRDKRLAHVWIIYDVEWTSPPNKGKQFL